MPISESNVISINVLGKERPKQKKIIKLGKKKNNDTLFDKNDETEKQDGN